MGGRDSGTQQQLLTNAAFPRFLLFTATRSVCWHWESRSGLSSDDLPFQGGRASQEATTGPVLLCTNQPFMAQVGHCAAVPQAKVPSSGWPGSTPQGAAGKSQERNRSPERTAPVSETPPPSLVEPQEPSSPHGHREAPALISAAAPGPLAGTGSWHPLLPHDLLLAEGLDSTAGSCSRQGGLGGAALPVSSQAPFLQW